MASGRFEGGFSAHKLEDALRDRLDKSAMQTLSLAWLRAFADVVPRQPDNATLRFTRENVLLKVGDDLKRPDSLEEAVDVGGGFEALILVRDGVLAVTLAKPGARSKRVERVPSTRLPVAQDVPTSSDEDQEEPADERLRLSQADADSLVTQSIKGFNKTDRMGELPDELSTIIREALPDFVLGTDTFKRILVEDVLWSSLGVVGGKYTVPLEFKVGDVEMNVGLYINLKPKQVEYVGEGDEKKEVKRDVSTTRVEFSKLYREPKK